KQTVQVDRLWAVKQGKETRFDRKLISGGGIQIGGADRKTVQQPGTYEFRDESGTAWTKADTTGITQAIIIQEKEGGEKIRFEPRLDRDGNFTAKEPFPPYYEVNGRRVMDELGQVTLSSFGMWLLNIFLNLLHFGVWFVCLWLLLKFQWPHALG